MKYCPLCQSSLRCNQKCNSCGWGEKEAMLRQGSIPSEDEKKLVLESPPTCYRAEVNEVRYLTHCTNIAHIIAHCNTRSLRFERIKDYLRITKDEEVA